MSKVSQYSKIIYVLALLSSGVSAYELRTHQLISEQAFDRSMIPYNDFRFIQQLGLKKNETFLGSLGELKAIRELLADGAKAEDDGSRPIKHFFNPLTGSGIDPFKSSPEFMLTDFLGEGQRGGGANPYTYPDAVDYFYRAMTLSTKTERDANWGRLFETLGHLIHHIQDMAQPQHVRSDPHLKRDETIEGWAAWFDNYILRTPFLDPSEYESYTNSSPSLETILQTPYGNPGTSIALYYETLFKDFTLPAQFWSRQGVNGPVETI